MKVRVVYNGELINDYDKSDTSENCIMKSSYNVEFHVIDNLNDKKKINLGTDLMSELGITLDFKLHEVH